MGDGQHVWAAAEWVMMMRNSFVYEEPGRRRLVIGAGLRPEWLTAGNRLSFGPAPTTWGDVNISIVCRDETIEVACESNWRGAPPEIIWRPPGRQGEVLSPSGKLSIRIGVPQA